MAPPDPKPLKSHSRQKRKRSHPHQHEDNPSQQQQQPNHQQREEYPAPKMIKPSSAWADLPQELVETILGRLPLEDYSPFGLACKSWWSAMLNVRPLFKPPPILILKPCHPLAFHLDDPRDRAREAEATRFYAMCGGGKHHKLPMIRPNPFNTTSAARCCGTSMGWLFMVDVNDESSVHLLNPISAEKVELPALPPYITLWTRDEVICSKSASEQDCVVAVQGSVIDGGSYTVLLTCRPKDDEWIEIPYKSRVYTFALYEGRLYVIAEQRMDIYHLDPGPRKISSIILDDRICKKRNPFTNDVILVIMDGKLLLVCGAFYGHRHVYKFVYNRWVKIQSLGEWVLLMNRFTSQAFSTKESPTLGFRANCIYQQAPGAMFVYSMEDASSLTVSFPRPETGSSIAGGWFQAYWFLAQSW